MRIRLLLGTAVLLMLGPDVFAQEVVRLYPGKAPGSENWKYSEQTVTRPGGEVSVVNVTDPTMTVYLPDPAKATGTAVIVCPGGGFRMLSWNNEGVEVARWLNSKGIAAFVLKYRIVQTNPAPPSVPAAAAPPPGRPPAIHPFTLQELQANHANANPAPENSETVAVVRMGIADGQQAIRIIRRDAAKYHVNSQRVGILGFSAGGGVAVGTAVADPSDAYPDFVISLYGPSLIDVKVPEKAAPLFIGVGAHHFNVTFGCLALFELWNQAGKSAEIHVYDIAQGAWGMNSKTQKETLWLDSLYEWMQRKGFVS